MHYRVDLKTYALPLFALLLVAINALVWVDPWYGLNLNGWLYMVYYIGVSTLMYLTPWILFGRHSKIFYWLTLPLLIVLDGILGFVYLNFHFRLYGIWVGILMSSNWDEFRFFVVQHALDLVALFIAWVVGFMLCGKILRKLPDLRSSRFTLVLRLATLALIILSVATGYTWDRNSALNLLVDTCHTYRQHRQMSRLVLSPRFSSDLDAVSPLSTNTVGVVVIGESATRGHFGLFGYSRPTTPRLEALRDELILFPQARTASFSTFESLLYLLTTATRDNPNDFSYTFPQVLKKAGYSVALFSNQRHWGEYDSTTQYVFAGCDEMSFVAEQKPRGELCYDLELLHGAREWISKHECSIALLHQIGSHAPFANDYPPGKAVFPVRPVGLRLHTELMRDPELKRNHYDNSIHYTDEFLGELIAKLKKDQRISWLVYISDHGETPDIPEWRVATDPATWEIPFIVWLSPSYRVHFPEKVNELETMSRKPFRSDHLLPLLIDLACRVKQGGIER